MVEQTNLVGVHPLRALGSVDGRYASITKPLQDYFSEMALMKYRTIMEGEYLIYLSEHPGITGIRDFEKDEVELIRGLYDLTLEDAEFIKIIEKTDHGIEEINNGKKTNHDVKSIELYLRYKLRETSLSDCLESIHWALTSEDVTNISYALMLSDGIKEVLLPTIENLYETIENFTDAYTPILGRTHGQPASPTTYEKEFKVFSSRIKRKMNQLEEFEILAKLNGATGNYNAFEVAYPGIDWLDFSTQFIESFNDDERKIKLKPNLITTQIESHDTYAELFDIFKNLNTIIMDLNQDMWRYISDNWLVQKTDAGDVGSSAMPHKVNPIDFENSEGNLGMANALYEFFARKLPISRLQRDLSDSTVLRMFGTAFGLNLIEYKSTIRGLSKIYVNEEGVLKDLESHPEVVAEAYNSILRREGVKNAYGKLKDLTRGREITIELMHEFVDSLGDSISSETMDELKKVTPTNYTGIAKTIARLNLAV